MESEIEWVEETKMSSFQIIMCCFDGITFLIMLIILIAMKVSPAALSPHARLFCHYVAIFVMTIPIGCANMLIEKSACTSQILMSLFFVIQSLYTLNILILFLDAALINPQSSDPSPVMTYQHVNIAFVTIWFYTFVLQISRDILFYFLHYNRYHSDIYEFLCESRPHELAIGVIWNLILILFSIGCFTRLVYVIIRLRDIASREQKVQWIIRAIAMMGFVVFHSYQFCISLIGVSEELGFIGYALGFVKDTFVILLYSCSLCEVKKGYLHLFGLLFPRAAVRRHEVMPQNEGSPAMVWNPSSEELHQIQTQA